MTTPLEQFFDWFDHLPVKYRQDLAFEVGTLLPGVDVNPYDRKFLENFINQLDNLKKPGVAKEYGLLLCIKTVIDAVVTAKKHEGESWLREKKMLDDMAQRTGSCAIALQASVQATQATQWTALAEKWQTLASQTLSPENLEQWYRSVSSTDQAG